MSDSIKFLLNGEIKEVKNISPTMTVLEYLRNIERLNGTKEGCAEGDCGACTVAFGELIDGKIKYTAVNSCIIFMPKLHGKLLVTVEGLAKQGHEMHPVQKLMYEKHGSQCGFCTPGFIMSLFAYYHQDEDDIKRTDDEIHEVLAGNLCRCTGYRPIIEVAKQIGGKKQDWYLENEKELIEKLESLNLDDKCSYEYEGQKFFSPKSLNELDNILAKENDYFLFAGGTDLGLLKTKANKRLEVIVQTSEIKDLCEIKETNDDLEIGSAVTYSQALPLIEKHYPEFGKLIRRIGSTQIRNLGTMGGNIGNASPIGDSPPCLIALNAKLVIRSKENKREEFIKDFYIGYRKTKLEIGEYIEKIIIPKPTKNQIFKVYKLTKRFDQDISAVCGAFNLVIENETIKEFNTGFGGMDAIPRKAKSVEKYALGKKWNEKTAKELSKLAKKEFSPMSDFRASADYRAKTAGNIISKLYIETTNKEELTEVWSL